MTLPDANTLYDVIDGTWPAAHYEQLGPNTLRRGDDGGQRVSAATAHGPVTDQDLDAAETAMRAMGQASLFMIREGQDDLDNQLAKRGYDVVDPVNLYACPVEALTTEPIPLVTAIPVWEPLAIMRDIWAAGSIGPGRIAVMERAQTPKTGLIGRWQDHPGGCAFVAMHKNVAMLHALEILPHQRNQGLGKWMMRRAAFWAQERDATHMSVICTQANAGANALYASLSMTFVGQYHYRKLIEAPS